MFINTEATIFKFIIMVRFIIVYIHKKNSSNITVEGGVKSVRLW